MRISKFIEAQGKIPANDAHAGAEYRTRKVFRALPRQTPWDAHGGKHRKATSETEAKDPTKYKEAQFWPEEASTPKIAETVTKRMEKEALVRGLDKAMKSQDVQTLTDGRETGRTYAYFDNGVMVFHSSGTIHIYYRFDKRVGFYQGKETQWIRVELSNVFHGHPVPVEEILKVPGMRERFNSRR